MKKKTLISAESAKSIDRRFKVQIELTKIVDDENGSASTNLSQLEGKKLPPKIQSENQHCSFQKQIPDLS